MSYTMILFTLSACHHSGMIIPKHSEDHSKLMEPALDPTCVKYHTEPRICHLIINMFLCTVLILYVAMNPTLKNMYKFNFIPLLLIVIVQSNATLGFYSVSYASCYHFLIRPPLLLRYSNGGLIISLVIPIALSIFP
ncbi:hypothetical protein PENTCL1PPCAC_3833, partial [Pristionchus entomophagus]